MTEPQVEGSKVSAGRQYIIQIALDPLAEKLTSGWFGLLLSLLSNLNVAMSIVKTFDDYIHKLVIWFIIQN